jgi:hypothetical protein
MFYCILIAVGLCVAILAFMLMARRQNEPVERTSGSDPEAERILLLRGQRPPDRAADTDIHTYDPPDFS